MIKKLKDLTRSELERKRVLVRLDLDVPVAGGQVTEDFRLKRAVPTLEFLIAAGAEVTAIGHLGRAGDSLKPAQDYWRTRFPAVTVLENLRQNPGEEANDPKFAQELAGQADIYVNDAFAACHRAHASIVSVPKLLPSYAGLNLAKEIDELSKAFNPPRPFILILGGAKFETKLPVVEKFINLADKIFIYGALAHSFFRARGYEIGRSLVADRDEIVKPFLWHEKIVLPSDVRVERAGKISIKTPKIINPEDKVMDIGLESVEKLIAALAEAKFILWNGPVGFFEEGFNGGTDAIAKLIAGSGAESIIGGGDTIAAIGHLGILNQFSFVSTGGGAMLEFLAQGTLPGIEALK